MFGELNFVKGAGAGTVVGVSPLLYVDYVLIRHLPAAPSRHGHRHGDRHALPILRGMEPVIFHFRRIAYPSIVFNLLYQYLLQCTAYQRNVNPAFFAHR